MRRNKGDDVIKKMSSYSAAEISTLISISITSHGPTGVVIPVSAMGGGMRAIYPPANLQYTNNSHGLWAYLNLMSSNRARNHKSNPIRKGAETE